MTMLETILEAAPGILKTRYVAVMKVLKASLRSCGLLQKLDSRVHSDRRFHYLRSLLAIHQIEDLVWLDVPWWTYTAIDAVDEYLAAKEGARVLEYGSGASTVWLAKKARSVVSIEHDPSWCQTLKDQFANPGLLHLKERVTILLRPPDSSVAGDERYRSGRASGSLRSYVHAVEEFEKTFDLIVIDGRCRCESLSVALPYLAPGGLIVFDNSNRSRYQPTLRDSGLTVRRFKGWVPGSPFPSETALLSY